MSLIYSTLCNSCSQCQVQSDRVWHVCGNSFIRSSYTKSAAFITNNLKCLIRAVTEGCCHIITSFYTLQLVLKLQTNTSEEHFLEACMREERDEWAAAIGAAVQKLNPHDAQTPSPSQMKGSTSLQLHNVNLRQLCVQFVNICEYVFVTPYLNMYLYISQVVDSMYDVHSGIRLCSHVEQGSSYTNCFSGQTLKNTQ